MFEDIGNGITKTFTGSGTDTLTVAEARWTAGLAAVAALVAGSKWARYNMLEGNKPFLGIIG